MLPHCHAISVLLVVQVSLEMLSVITLTSKDYCLSTRAAFQRVEKMSIIGMIIRTAPSYPCVTLKLNSVESKQTDANGKWQRCTIPPTHLLAGEGYLQNISQHMWRWFYAPIHLKKKKKDFPDFLIPLDSPRTLWQGWKGHFCWLWTSTCINTQIPNLGLRDASLQPPSCSGELTMCS